MVKTDSCFIYLTWELVNSPVESDFQGSQKQDYNLQMKCVALGIGINRLFSTTRKDAFK